MLSIGSHFFSVPALAMIGRFFAAFLPRRWSSADVKSEKRPVLVHVPAAMAASDPKKLVEYLLGDMRVLSTEAKKKHAHVKDVRLLFFRFVLIRFC